MLVTSLERIDNPQDLGGVTAGRSGVRHDETNSFLGVNDKDRTDGERNALGVNVGGVLVINPIKDIISTLYIGLKTEKVVITCRRCRRSFCPCHQ